MHPGVDFHAGFAARNDQFFEQGFPHGEAGGFKPGMVPGVHFRKDGIEAVLFGLFEHGFPLVGGEALFGGDPDPVFPFVGGSAAAPHCRRQGQGCHPQSGRFQKFPLVHRIHPL
jgi:hypothetical protein